MKHTLLIALCLSFGIAMSAQTKEKMARTSCTSIMVGKNASVDGSVMTSHTCDSWYRTWMQIVPARDYPRDTVMAVYDGRMHTESPEDSTKMYVKGVIPQVHHTYRYLDTAYPCLNEKQLAIGETTFGGRDTLQNKKGMFMIEELARVALERCSTAREAIRLMGDLIKKYGYGDSGECLTIADKQEVWIFEVMGEGPKKIGGVWAAVRIPDDEIAVSANISRIHTLNLADKDNYMASDNVFDVAKRLKLWDGKGEFSFFRAYSGANYFDEKKNYSVREHFIMSQLAPSLCLSDTMEILPLSVKPDKKVSAEDVMRLLGSYYEGTDQSLSCKIDSISKSQKRAMTANPWMRPDEIAMHAASINDTTFTNIRTVSVSWCAYSTVLQCRSWLPDDVGGVAWVLLDNPGESPRFPIFSGCTKLPSLLNICGQHNERDDAALWHYRKANRLATLRWGKFRNMIEGARDHFITKGIQEMPFVEQTYKSLAEQDSKENASEGDKDAKNNGNSNAKDEESAATKFLNGYTSDFFGATISTWDDITRKLWRQTWAGF